MEGWCLVCETTPGAEAAEPKLIHPTRHVVRSLHVAAEAVRRGATEPRHAA